MFTGIVKGIGVLTQIDDKTDFRSYTIKLPQGMAHELQLGSSIANNGCCLTVTKVDGDYVSFDLMKETLKLTNLGELKINDGVNVERAAKFGDEIGGHPMSGHITCTAEIQQIIKSENNYQVIFLLPEKYMKYVLNKGYIGVDGISLTVCDVTKNSFSVNLIPETLMRTTLATKSVGQRVNIEFDTQTQAIVDTVERVLEAKLIDKN